MKHSFDDFTNTIIPNGLQNDRSWMMPSEDISMEFLSILMQDEENKKAGNIAPDTLGADKFFLEGFITPKMSYDFWVIARDFLSHHFVRLKEFDDLASYGNDKSYQTDPQRALQLRILNILYKAAKANDPYCVELIKILYKTYHKREYQQLKRFRKISIPEIFSLAEDEFEITSYPAIGRILGMCMFYGIEPDDKISVLYLLLDRKSTEYEAEEEVSFFQFKEGLFEECLAQVDAWMSEAKRKSRRFDEETKTYWDVEHFVSLCFEHEGYPSDFIYRCDSNYCGQRILFAKTFALLKSAYPKKSFSYEDVQLYAHIYRSIITLIDVCDMYDDATSQFFGIGDDRHEIDQEKCLFNPGSITYDNQEKKTPVQTFIPLAPVASGDAKEADYLSEIADLRKRLHEKEQAHKSVREELAKTKAALKETEEILKKYENDREELIALRNHVYNLSEGYEEVASEDIETMQKELAEHNIVIVGGHINWINKLKRVFKNWSFVDPNALRAVDDKLLDGAERVYFFTDHMNHRTYNKFITIVRETKIPFGYLHTINIETVTKQIYRDIT